MKKISAIKIILLVGLCVAYILIAACSKTNEEATGLENKDDIALYNQHDDTDEIVDFSAQGGGYDEFNLRFLTSVENIHYADVIMGADFVQMWVDDVYLKLSEEEMHAIPALYRVIHDLNIRKEEFVALSNKFSDMGAELMSFPPYVTEALFNDDVTEMKRVLVNEKALFYGGEIYTWAQVRKATNEGALIALGLPQQVLLDFANERLTEFRAWQEEWLGYKTATQKEYNEYREYMARETNTEWFSFSLHKGVDPNDWRFLFESEEAYFMAWEDNINQQLNASSYRVKETLDVIASITNTL